MAEKSDKSFTDSAVETVKTVFWALIIAGVFRSIFFQPFWIPSGSMKDSLLIGDFLFVNKMAYGYSYASCPKVQIPAVGLNLDADDFCFFLKNKEERILGGDPVRGDVVVFRHPLNGTDFIKRLIGLPGETVQMRNGRLYINGAPVGLERDGEFVETYEDQGPLRHRPICMAGAAGLGEDCVKEKYIETLPGGVQHSILNVRTSSLDNTGVFTVPPGHYFFMGDNRDNSGDSRVLRSNGGVHFVPAKDIVGRADRVIFSSGGDRMLKFWTWRGDRFFKKIQ